MAKVSDIKFDIGGEKVVVNINCNSGGQFTARIPGIVASALDLDTEVRADTLVEVKNQVSDAVDKFKNAKTTEELFIAIQYGSNGGFNEDSKGRGLHGGNRSDSYSIDITFSEHQNVLSFNHQVCIKRTVAGVVTWYEADLGKNIHTASWEKKKKPKQYYTTDKFSHVDDWKIIPYSQKAFESLSNAKEKLRSISEMLYTFIEQDEKMIESTLTNTKFLNA